MFFREGTDFRSANMNRSDRNALREAMAWPEQCRMPLADRTRFRKLRYRSPAPNVMDVHGFSVDTLPGRYGSHESVVYFPRTEAPESNHVMRQAKTVAVNYAKWPHRCIAQPCGGFGNHVEHRLDIRRRAGDNAQDFTRGRLLLQRFLEFLEQPHVLDGDHGLVGEGLEQLDLLVGEGTNLDVGGSDYTDRDAFAQQWRGKMRSNA